MHKPGIPHDALVLVGDGTRAVFFRNRGSVQQPRLVVEHILEQQNPPTRAQGTDRPGRRAGGDAGTLRSAIEETDWHQLGEERFAQEIADRLYRSAHANQFQRLIIVAPPKVLGALRKTLHKAVLERLEAEVPKELAGYSVPSLCSELASWG